MLAFATFSQHSIESYSQNNQEEEIKHIQIGKEVVKLSLFVDGVILCIEIPKHSSKIF